MLLYSMPSPINITWPMIFFRIFALGGYYEMFVKQRTHGNATRMCFKQVIHLQRKVNAANAQ